MSDCQKTPFEKWHYINGNNTQGIHWVDKLVRSAWDEGTKNESLRTASELSRLHEVNLELLGALNFLVDCSAPMTGQQEECWISIRAAIAKANAWR